jgi:hypothetical protein
MNTPTVKFNNKQEELVLLCPSCDSDYLHPRLSTNFRNTAGGFFKNPTGNYTQYDRGYISIQFDCECCDSEPELIIYNRKGECYFKWHSVRKEI